jgi:Ca2+-binding RTX toxin-like protein
VLWLTDDLHGDALCLDDMFSEFGDAGRVLAFDEVNAGAGDDLLDFTSNRFQENGTALTLRGGAGNDIIWAGTGRPFILYGDEGDDILVGGGNVGDQFVFQGDWGNDTVQQLAGAPVELVFRGVDIQVEGIIADGNTLFDFGENRKVTVLGRTEGINVNYEL